MPYFATNACDWPHHIDEHNLNEFEEEMFNCVSMLQYVFRLDDKNGKKMFDVFVTNGQPLAKSCIKTLPKITSPSINEISVQLRSEFRDSIREKDYLNKKNWLTPRSCCHIMFDEESQTLKDDTAPLDVVGRIF
jgi:hypothetical protein